MKTFVTEFGLVHVSGTALAHAQPVCVVWQPSAALSKAGVFLFRGQATALGRAYLCEMTLTLQDGAQHVQCALVSKKGKILEMFALRSAPKAVCFNFIAVSGDVAQVELSCRRVSAPECWYRQWRRIIPALRRASTLPHLDAGLRWRDALQDRQHAYLLATRARLGSYVYGYEAWCNEFYGVTPQSRRVIETDIAKWQHHAPAFDIVLVADDRPGCAQRMLQTRASLEQQIYGYFQIHEARTQDWQEKLPAVLSPASEHNDAASAQWCLVLEAGTCLSPHALYWIAERITKKPEVEVVYCDHDYLDAEGQRHFPVFKPDWSASLLDATNYVDLAFAWRITSERYASTLFAAKALPAVSDAMYAVLLTLAHATNRQPFAHVAVPLVHFCGPFADVRYGDQHDVTAHSVAGYFSNQHVRVESLGSGRQRIRYELAVPAPRVSIVIPTRDGLTHLRPCIESLVAKTTYPNYEIIVVDNQSVLPETIDYFSEISKKYNVRIIAFNAPFNYSSINNYAVEHADGEIICLLNNDTEIDTSDWLEEMVGHLNQPGVGIVGAKLLYGDGRVQHAGDAVGPGGCADHFHVGIGRDDPGYCGRALVAQDLSAVTAACLLTHASLFRRLGGLNARDLPVAFNDVDYCLRVREAGFRVIWTPHAVLYHHESVSRGKDVSRVQKARARKEVRYMRKRWGHVMRHDPFYNPNLNYQRPDFSLAAVPRVDLPWEKRETWGKAR